MAGLPASSGERGNDGDGDAVTDDGVSLAIATRGPARVLAGLARREALAGLRVQGAALEDTRKGTYDAAVQQQGTLLLTLIAVRVFRWDDI